MKKLLLLCGLGLSTAAFGQAIVFVEEPNPSPIAGNVSVFTYADSWGMNLENFDIITDTLVLVDAGGADDSLGCGALQNAAAVSGHIALIYRGTCDFSYKAFNAQSAGAIAVVIINNAPGAPIEMGAGDNAGDVVIPVVMIQQDLGAGIRAQMALGEDVVVTMGNKTGYFDNDLGFQNENVVRTPFYSYPTALAGAGEMDITLGGWLFNYGQDDQTGVTVTAQVMQGATQLYTATSAADDVDAGDSTYFSVANYVNATALTAGEYSIVYTVNHAGDQYTGDNSLTNAFRLNNAISAARTDANGLPESTTFSMPADFDTKFDQCVHFMNDNASRIGVDGVYFEAEVNDGFFLDGTVYQAFAFEWNTFTDLNDNAGFDVSTLDPVATNEEFIVEGEITATPIFVPFEEPLVLEDNQRYLFCISSVNPDVFLGFTNEFNYDQTLDTLNQPIHPLIMGEDGAQLFLVGFTGSPVPTVTARTFPADELSINENFISASSFPNPAKDVVTVKIDASGDANLMVTDLAGRTVVNSVVNIADGKFTTNVSQLNAGTYVFNLTLADGTSRQFKVVVAK